MAKRNLTADDRRILDTVINVVGKKRIFWIYDGMANRNYKWKEGETVGLLHFLHEISEDYTYRAIFDAIDQSKATKKRKVAA